MIPKVEVHILTFQEQDILPYSLRHYNSFAKHVVVHDAHSTDDTRQIAKDNGALVLDWDCPEINDMVAMNLKNVCWKGTAADFVICADADELIYFPKGAEFTLSAYHEMGVPVVKPHGYELCSGTFPTTTGQIYEEVKFGAADDKWYAKPILFSPHHVAEIGLGIGAHSCRALLKGHRPPRYHCPTTFTEPPAFLLHCKHLGPVERIAKEYNADLTRLSALNKKHRWGNQGDGLTHAREKRTKILSKLVQVIS